MKSLVVVALMGAVAIAVVYAQEAPSRSVWDGVFTQGQAQRGQSSYNQYCMACHGGSLTGGEQAPPLAGGEFLSNWNGLTVGDLFDRIRQSMPSDNPGSISPRQASDLVSHILATNGFPAGQKELDRELPPLKEIRIETK